MTHVMKSWPAFFGLIKAGRKNFDVRRMDRSFSRGDFVILLEYVKGENRYTGDALVRRIGYITTKTGGEACAYSDEALTEGFCILGYMGPFDD